METSLAFQWLRVHAANAGAVGLILGQGTKISHVVWYSPKIFKKDIPIKKKVLKILFLGLRKAWNTGPLGQIFLSTFHR